MGSLKFTPQVRERYFGLLRKCGRRMASARAVGVDPVTVWRARKVDPEFAELEALAELECFEKAETKLLEAVDNGEPWAVQMALKARDRGRWGDRTSVEVSGSVTMEIGPVLERIAMLQATLAARAALAGAGHEEAPALGAGASSEIVDAELVDDEPGALEDQVEKSPDHQDDEGDAVPLEVAPEAP